MARLLFDILLDISRIEYTSTLSGNNHLRHEFCVCDGFASFHNPNNCCLRFEIAICRNPFVGLLILRFGFLCLDLVDLNAILLIRETLVHRKGVGVIDIFASWRLCEDAVLCACKRLQCSLQFVVIYKY